MCNDVTIKGMAVISIIATTVMFGRFNLADMTTIEDIDQLVIYLYCLYAFLFSILLTGMFEGIMFTYAILKNDILGIDEKLRKAFSTTIFAGIGGIILITTEGETVVFTYLIILWRVLLTGWRVHVGRT